MMSSAGRHWNDAWYMIGEQAEIHHNIIQHLVLICSTGPRSTIVRCLESCLWRLIF